MSFFSTIGPFTNKGFPGPPACSSGRWVFSTFGFFLLFFLITVPARPALSGTLDAETIRKAVEAAEAAKGKRLDDYVLVDQDGVEFHLSDYFKGKRPLLISFIYTSCAHTCPTITGVLKRTVDEAEKRLGRSLSVLTIGFDTERDTPESLRRYGLRFTSDFSDFRFATGSKETIERLTKRLGFFYKYNGDGSFDHLDMVSLVRPDGRVYAQVYSLRTQSERLLRGIEELVTGKAPEKSRLSLIDRIKFFCSRYDPYTGTYVVDYAVIFGFFIQLMVIVVIIMAVWGGRIKVFFVRFFGTGHGGGRTNR